MSKNITRKKRKLKMKFFKKSKRTRALTSALKQPTNKKLHKITLNITIVKNKKK